MSKNLIYYTIVSLNLTGQAVTNFNPDFYRFDEQLTDEEKMIRDSLREFINEKQVRDEIKSCNTSGKPLSLELLRRLASLGVVGANIPDDNNERLSNRGYGIITREVEAGDSALRSFVSVQSSLVIYPIWRFGSPEQKLRWLEPLRSASAIGCFGLTEPYGGSNPAGLMTSFTEKSDCYVLNGSKTWITNSPIADVAIIWARAREKYHGFLVERGTPGFRTDHIENKGSLRASCSGTISLQDCIIPKENILPGTSGIKSAFACLNKARYGIAWGTAGIVRECYKKIWELTQNRAPFGTTLDSKQLVQDDLARIDSNLTTILALCFRLSELADKTDIREISEAELGSQISYAKWQCIELAIDSVDRCLELAGADGLTYEYPFWAHFANLRTLRTYEGTKKIHTLIQGQRITGKTAF